MSFYEKLEDKIVSIKNEAAVYGRQIQESEFSAPSVSKIKNSIGMIATSFANLFHANINTDFNRLQQLESEIAVKRYDLNTKAKELCLAKKDDLGEQFSIQQRIKGLKQEIEALQHTIKVDEDTIKKIENEYLQQQTEGDLLRLPMWIFVTVMAIVGLAELFINQAVFLSQEIGILADKEGVERLKVDIMAFVMGAGFIVMITWLAHETGKRIRHIQGTAPEHRRKQVLIVSLIVILVFTVFFATVKLRSDMHQIGQKETILLDKQKEEEDTEIDINALLGEESKEGAENTDKNKADTATADEEEDLNLGALLGEEDVAKGYKTATSAKKVNYPTIDMKGAITQMKSEDSWYFLAINFFIFIGGVMLAYHSHTSSVRYEALESIVATQRRRLEALLNNELELISYLKNSAHIPVENETLSLWKKWFGKKPRIKQREQYKLLHHEQTFIRALKEYLDQVNTYDGLREELYAQALATQNSYINGVKTYLDTLSNYTSFDEFYATEYYQNQEFVQFFNSVALLDKYFNLHQQNGTEKIHIDNIEEFVQSIQCDQGEMKEQIEALYTHTPVHTDNNISTADKEKIESPAATIIDEIDESTIQS